MDNEGKLFAYSIGYDWHRGHEARVLDFKLFPPARRLKFKIWKFARTLIEANDPNTKPKIILRNVMNELKPKNSK